MDAPWRTGPEIQVLDNENFTGPNTLYHQAPALYDMKPIGNVKYNSYGKWNHLLLKVDHNNNLGSVTLNGEFVYSFPLSGPEWDEMVSRSKFSADKYYENLVPDHPYFRYAPFFGIFKTGKATLIIPNNNIPKNVPKTLPEPPVMLVPPIITPAITINSIPTPVTPGFTYPNLDA